MLAFIGFTLKIVKTVKGNLFHTHNIGEKILSVFSGASLCVVYSAFYNGLYMIPEIIITTVVAVVISKIPQITKTRA